MERGKKPCMDMGGERPKWKDTASANVVNEHIILEKEQSVKWSWITVNGERVAGGQVETACVWPCKLG